MKRKGENTMPVARLLPAEEAAKFEKKPTANGQRKAMIALYDQLLGDFAPDEFVEVTLDTSENKAAVRHQLKQAAKRRGYGIVFRRTKEEGRIVLKLSANGQADE
jgi:hypothetical protein